MKVRVELEVDIPWIKKVPASFATLDSTMTGIKRDIPVRMSQARLVKMRILEESDEQRPDVERHVSRAASRGSRGEAPEVEGQEDSLVRRIEQALLARHPVTLPPQRARNYAELAAFVVNGGS